MRLTDPKSLLLVILSRTLTIVVIVLNMDVEVVTQHIFLITGLLETSQRLDVYTSCLSATLIRWALSVPKTACVVLIRVGD